MSPSERQERKYLLTKLAKGDYLLRGNDGRTIWRLRTYTDCPSDDGSIGDRVVWGVWKWIGDSTLYVDIADSERWEKHDGPLPTRAAAIEGALR